MTRPDGGRRIWQRGLSSKGEEGQIAGVEGLALGILIFILGILAVVDSWAVIDAKIAVDTAASQAVRAYVTAPNSRTATSDAITAASQVISASGRRPASMIVSITGDLRRCSVVTARVTYPVRMALIPAVKGFGPVVVVSGLEAELVDPLRSGASGPIGQGATCG